MVRDGSLSSLRTTFRRITAIRRSTPAGGFVAYPLPADESSPAGITAGPRWAISGAG